MWMNMAEVKAGKVSTKKLSDTWESFSLALNLNINNKPLEGNDGKELHSWIVL